MLNDRVTIVSQERLAPGIEKITLLAPEIARAAAPGQFVNLYSDEKDKLLPRPISICEVDPERGLLILIYAVVGKGTAEMAAKQAGDTMRVLGPLGKGFPL